MRKIKLVNKSVARLLLFLSLFLFSVFQGSIFSFTENNVDILEEERVNHAPGEVIIKIKEGSHFSVTRTIEENSFGIISLDRISQKYNLISKERPFVDNLDRGAIIKLHNESKDSGRFTNVYRMVFPEELDLAQIVEEYKKNPYIEYAHLNYFAVLHQTPNDTHFGSQWGLQKIEALNAWGINKGSEEVLIAVVDTGIDYNHEDLAANMWNGSGCVDYLGNPLGGCVHGYDFHDGDNNPLDGHGHGTHVAGIIGAVTNNATGIAGVTWNSRLMAVKIFSNDGIDTTGDILTGANAIYFAVRNGAKIISNSWGYDLPGEIPGAIKDAIDYANTQGALVIFAAGNDGSEETYQPGAYSGTLAVAATDQNDARSIWPSGKSSNYGTWVDVSAPGTSILSTITNNEYASYNGTSMAAPFVSGLAALIWSQDSDLTREEVWSAITGSADNIDIENVGYEGKLGSGRINAYSALSSITTPVNFIEGGGVIGASIDIFGDEIKSDLIKEDITTNDTGLAFTFLNQGNYWFSASKEGYYDYNGSFVVSASELDVSFQMQKTPVISIADYSAQLTNERAGHNYGDISVWIFESNNVDVENVEISFTVRNEESVIVFDDTEVVTTITGGSSVSALFSLGGVVTVGNYDAIVTVNASNIVGETTREATFAISSGLVGNFALNINEVPLNNAPVFEISSGVDMYGNVLNNEYEATFVVTNSLGGIIYNETATIAINSGAASYTPSSLVSVTGSYSAMVTIDTVDQFFNFNVVYVFVTSVGILESNQDIEAGGTLQLNHTVSPTEATNKNVSYSSSNGSVLVVSESGLVEAVGNSGESATITITTECGEFTDIITLSIIAPTYTVTLQESNNLVGVSVQLYSNSERTTPVGGVLTTNSSGVATTTLESGTYWFSASKSGYDIYEGSFLVLNIPDTFVFELSATTYTVTLQESNNLVGVSVQLYSNSERTTPVGGVLTTNSSGVATTTLEDGTYWISASKSGYSNYEGSFTVSGSPRTVNFTMSLIPEITTYTVTMRESNNLIGVSVRLYSDSGRTISVGGVLTTNSSGVATITLENGTYWFSATKTSYNVYNSYFVVNNVPRTTNFTMTLAYVDPNPPANGGGGDADPDPVDPDPVTIPPEDNEVNEIIKTNVFYKATFLIEQRDRLVNIKKNAESLLKLAEGSGNINARTFLLAFLERIDKLEKIISRELGERENVIKDLTSQRDRLFNMTRLSRNLLELARAKENELAITVLISVIEKIDKIDTDLLLQINNL